MLTKSEAAALRNLAEMSGGSVTAFLSIADARRLTDLGLVQRSRLGWGITPEGAAHLAASDAEARRRAALPASPEEALDDETGGAAQGDTEGGGGGGT